jgi:hypothetical protein
VDLALRRTPPIGLGRQIDTEIHCAASYLNGSGILHGQGKMAEPFSANAENVGLTTGSESLAHLRDQLKEKDEAYRLLVDAHGRLLQARAARYARVEARLHSKLRLMEEECTNARAKLTRTEDGLSKLRSDFMEVEIGSKQAAGEVADLRKQLALADARINSLLSSRSWKVTAPLRRGTLSLVAFRALGRGLSQRCRRLVKVVVPRLNSLKRPVVGPPDGSSVVERYEHGAGQRPPSGNRRE